MPEQVTVGRIVHYVLPKDGRFKETLAGLHGIGAHRPAVVVHVWPNHPVGQLVQLHVFYDGTNDLAENQHWGGWATSVKYSEGKEPGTWHWPERA